MFYFVFKMNMFPSSWLQFPGLFFFRLLNVEFPEGCNRLPIILKQSSELDIFTTVFVTEQFKRSLNIIARSFGYIQITWLLETARPNSLNQINDTDQRTCFVKLEQTNVNNLMHVLNVIVWRTWTR